jgi:hypothetical protein
MITSKMQKAIDRGVQVVGEEWLYRSGDERDTALATTRANSKLWIFFLLKYRASLVDSYIVDDYLCS